MTIKAISVSQPTDEIKQEWDEELATPEGIISYCARVSSEHQANPEYEKLIRYCVKHGHVSILEHASMTVEIPTSRSISPQLLRHRSFCVGGSTQLDVIQPGKTVNKPQKHTIKELADKLEKGARPIETASSIKKRQRPRLPANRKWYTPAEVETITGVKATNVCTLCSKGTVAAKKHEGTWRVDTLSFNAWLSVPYFLRVPLQDRIRNMSIRCYDEQTKKVVKTKILDVWHSGTKELFKVTLASGKTIEITKDHRFLTDTGEYKTLDDYSDPLEITMMSLCSKSGIKDPSYAALLRARKRELHWCQQYKKEACQRCGGRSNLEIHHTIPVGSDLSNLYPPPEMLETLCERCHAQEHTKNPNPKAKHRMKVKADKVISCSSLGEQPVYDISVEHKDHNFFGNGVVLHNCFQEFSQRYQVVRQTPVITSARTQDTKNRQNSHPVDPDDKLAVTWEKMQWKVWQFAYAEYLNALDAGIAKELARTLLPGMCGTKLYMTGNVRSWVFFCLVRCDPSTQLEHRTIANECWKKIRQYFPTVAAAIETQNQILKDVT